MSGRSNGMSTLAVAMQRAGIGGAIQSYAAAAKAEFEMRNNFSIKEVTSQSGLSTSAVREILDDKRLPTRREHKALCRAFPRLKHMKLESFVAEETPTAAQKPKHLVPPAPKLVEPPTIVRAPDPPKQSSPTITSEPIRPSPLVVQSKTAEQYSIVEEVDPSLAALLLEGNVRNRKISRHLVSAMARDMREGRWRKTHQGIALDKDGRLVDGQHRLSAIVESGATIKILVTYNVDPDAFMVVDVGGRPRSQADVFFLKHGTKEASITVATLRILGGLGLASMTSILRVTPPEIEALHVKFGKDVAWAVSIISPKRNLGPWSTAPFVAACAYAMPTDVERVTDFLETTVSETAGKTKTMAALRRYLEGHRLVSYSERVDAAYVCFRAIDSHIRGVDLERVYLQGGSKGPAEGRSAGKEKEYRSFRSKRARLGLVE